MTPPPRASRPRNQPTQPSRPTLTAAPSSPSRPPPPPPTRSGFRQEVDRFKEAVIATVEAVEPPFEEAPPTPRNKLQGSGKANRQRTGSNSLGKFCPTWMNCVTTGNENNTCMWFGEICSLCGILFLSHLQHSRNRVRALFSGPIQGCTKIAFSGCENLVEKLHFGYLLLLTGNFFIPYSHNLGRFF